MTPIFLILLQSPLLQPSVQLPYFPWSYRKQRMVTFIFDGKMQITHAYQPFPAKPPYNGNILRFLPCHLTDWNMQQIFQSLKHAKPQGNLGK